MIEEKNNYYIYRHLKPCGEVFYIGMTKNLERAYNKKDRTSVWKEVMKKYPNYEVQILASNLSKEFAQELETFLIDWYKRIDCCGGTLVNLTDGGSATNGRIMAQWQKDHLSKIKKEGFENGTYKVNTEGVLKGIAERNRRWEENPELKEEMRRKVSEHHNIYEYLQIDRETNEIIEVFQNRLEIRKKFPNMGKTVILSVCNGSKKSYLGFLWRYRDRQTGKIIEPVFEENKRKKKVINKITKEVFESVISAAKSINMHPKTLGAKLTGKNPNDTDFIYLSEFEGKIS